MPSWQASVERHRRLRAALLAGTALFFASHPAFALSLRSGKHDGYARLVVDLPDPGGANAKVEGDALVVTLPDVAGAAPSAAGMRAVADVLGAPKLEDGGKTLRFALNAPSDLKVSRTQRGLVLDLSPAKPASTKPAATPQPAPERAAKPPAAQATSTAAPAKAAAAPVERVPVRVGVGTAATRIVFDWEKPTPYKISRDGGVLRVDFAAPGAIDVEAIRKRLPPAVADVSATSTAQGLGVSLTVGDAEVKDFTSGTKLVLDVAGLPSKPPAQASGKSVAGATAPVAAPQGEPAASPPPPTSPLIAAPPDAKSAPIPPAIAATGARATPAPSEADAPKHVSAPPAAPQPPVSVAPRIVQGANGPVLQLPVDAGLAAVQRGESLLIAVDRPAIFTLNEEKRRDGLALAALVSDGGTGGGAALRITGLKGAVGAPLRSASGWELPLRAARVNRNEPAVSVTGTAPEPVRVSIALPKAKTRIGVTDPVSGDQLTLVPTEAAAAGFDSERRYAQFTLLPTVQGLAIARGADDLMVLVGQDGVTIGAAGGLLVSTTSKPAGNRPHRIYDFGRWSGADAEFQSGLKELREAMLTATDAQRPVARFQLAQFLIARGHAADGIGELDILVDTDPIFREDPAVKALRGAARVLLGDAKAATDDLADKRLDGLPEAKLWRAAALSLAGQGPAANEAAKGAATLPKDYPAEMRGELIVLVADAAIQAGDLKRADALLSQMPAAARPALRERARYLRAMLALAGGDRALAVTQLTDLSNSVDPWTRAHATVAATDALLADHKIDRDEAIARLERIRFAWSGGPLEYDILRRLGDLYIAAGKPREGLEHLGMATRHFPDRPENEALKTRMTDVFVGLYTNETKPPVPPLTALAVYDDFRELTPDGARGDAMIQKLAERLVAVDLLDRASDLLEWQVKNRLLGVDRARVGARLAAIRLLDAKPEAALSALDLTAVEGVPPDVAAERRHLRVRAMLETGAAAPAIALLQGDATREADLLRADLFAASKDWPKAAEVLTRLVGTPPKAPLDKDDARLAVNLATARVLAGDDAGVKQLAADFKDKLPPGAEADAFALLTLGNVGGGIDSATVAKRFAEVSQFRAAVTDYREKVQAVGGPAS